MGLGLVAPSLTVPALLGFGTCLYCYGKGVGISVTWGWGIFSYFSIFLFSP